ncbi:hypothetical protein LSCM1_03002 [Leishmania martiniquensis]|uniref:Uncharacterized protein n=1 Tax=Leishmania martiniquensis TaxID=1580590 RepID=A0A836KKL6_9TRYP|nr:hypothetical protein LSCM1_03002 [Leishmania martiniquensis]
MAAIATLPETKWTGLLYICSDVVAACDGRVAHLVQHRGDTKVDEAICVSHSEASSFVPWLTPGAPVARVRAVWSVGSGPVHDVFVSLAETDGTTAATSPNAAPTKIISGITECVISLHIFYQSVLAVRTLQRVLFYSLDPSPLAANTATKIGVCELPKWVCEQATGVGLTSPTCSSAQREKNICVMCAKFDRVFIATIDCSSCTSAVVIRRTAMSGVRFSPSCAPDPKVTCAPRWTVRWSRQEMLMMCFSSADRAPRLAGFSLQPTKGREIAKWMSPEELAASVSGASPAAVAASSDLCSDGDGAHVWLCDTSTSSSVLLREVTGAPSKELVLPGVMADTQVAMVAAANGVFVLAGHTIYSVNISHMRAMGERPSEPAPMLSTSRSAEDSGSTSLPTSVTARLKEAALQYAIGKISTFPYILRDSVYVHKSGDAASGFRFTHSILSIIDQLLSTDPHQHALAYIRYSIIARSLHPYTVLELLRVRRGSAAEAPPEGLLLAIASTLADKPPLQNGGLSRLPPAEASVAAFFDSTGDDGPFRSEMEKKRYIADLCAAAKACLASGALGAAHLLLTVAARAATLIYGGTQMKSHAGAAQAHGKEERMYDWTIAECISIMRCYTDWSLTTSSSLGVMTAHVGAPHTLKKEAALRDGGAHPIETSRHAQIHQMHVLRQPKRSL